MLVIVSGRQENLAGGKIRGARNLDIIVKQHLLTQWKKSNEG